ncbi:MAG: flippase-like domain-containing protein [Actinomycetota bacterium]|nr:flippase-like domain-containing protein [Actinomycetota bacterium]
MSRTAADRSEPRGVVEDPDLAHDDDAGGPRLDFTPRKAAFAAVFVVVALGALYVLLPQLAGLDDTWRRLEQGTPGWLLLALLFTVGTFAGYVALFQAVFVRAGSRIDWRESYQICMAGLAATRLFSAGGAGGLVLIAWALRRSGMNARTVADRTVSFLVLQYLIYMLALIVCGFGLRWGLFEGPAPFSITVIPAFLALVITVLGLSVAFVPTDFERRLRGFASRQGRIGVLAQRLANGPAAASAGMRDALAHVRERDPALLGAVGYWAFQIGVLWAAFHAFGEPPAIAVLIMAFFVGMLGNLLPLPGGIGGVDGGMIGALVAFGVDGGLAVVSVLIFRAYTFWLPTLPGAIAYLQLRRTVDRWRTQRPLHYTN